MEIKTCPLCGGEMIKGKSKNSGHAKYFWKKPWSGILGGVVLAYPRLCINCGALIPYVDSKNLEKLKIEFEHKRMK
ncbi:conserved hypothetical protein [Ferroglobus placidus DSM 10642]|uniref:Uncharacterized protein n=1 Tax=Ferroglobus placidus (strain DSM 10642 / AEDII12DO) TaxID=589924 RepID=D3RZX7_FERPA|nr:hypothetical protein [Ferroglobus placidus]ADC66040.1 conserved hypothetical protein [Ferroglobus placidus DSM 10642]